MVRLRRDARHGEDGWQGVGLHQAPESSSRRGHGAYGSRARARNVMGGMLGQNVRRVRDMDSGLGTVCA